MQLIINELDCNGEGRQFERWVREHYPDIAIEYRAGTGGVGGGLYGDDGLPADYPALWDRYCDSDDAIDTVAEG